MPNCEHPSDKQRCIFKDLALEREGIELRHIHWCELCGALLDYVFVERRKPGITFGDIIKMAKEDLKQNARDN